MEGVRPLVSFVGWHMCAGLAADCSSIWLCPLRAPPRRALLNQPSINQSVSLARAFSMTIDILAIVLAPISIHFLGPTSIAIAAPLQFNYRARDANGPRCVYLMAWRSNQKPVRSPVGSLAKTLCAVCPLPRWATVMKPSRTPPFANHATLQTATPTHAHLISASAHFTARSCLSACRLIVFGVWPICGNAKQKRVRSTVHTT